MVEYNQRSLSSIVEMYVFQVLALPILGCTYLDSD
jgi:hypothetical protein